MKDTFPTSPTSKPGASAMLEQVKAMSASSSATDMLQKPANQGQVPQQQPVGTPGNSDVEDSNEKTEKRQHFIDVYLEGLSEPDQKLYRHIREEMLQKQKLSILMVTGELSYTFDFKGIIIEFSLLNGADKYSVDQYQFGRDPLSVFQAANDVQIAKRIQMYGETKSEAVTAFLDNQSLDSVGKRVTLITLALSIKLFNGKKLGDPTAAVTTIEKFQAPLIQKMAQVYNLFETVIMHILQDDNFLKN